MNTAQLVALWADPARTKTKARAGNAWFSGKTLYSYREPIAKFVTGHKGKPGCLVTHFRFSNTTAITINLARIAAKQLNLPLFTIPCVGNEQDQPNHTANLHYFLAAMLEAHERGCLFNDPHATARIKAQAIAEEQTAYRRFFHLDAKPIKPDWSPKTVALTRATRKAPSIKKAAATTAKKAHDAMEPFPEQAEAAIAAGIRPRNLIKLGRTLAVLAHTDAPS